MSYMHIDNLYSNATILLFRECFAMEKIDGTSSHIQFHNNNLTLFSGGAKYEDFTKLFDVEMLTQKLIEKGIPIDIPTVIYGEAYGGKIQGLRNTYGDKLKFIAFEVRIGEMWLNVQKANSFVETLGLEFVPYNKIPATLDAINIERDRNSIQAIINGCGDNHMREGIVLRPLEEMKLNDRQRVIAKHKRDEFRETHTIRKVLDVTRLKVLEDAKAIAVEWVTQERLNHILTSGKVEAAIENTGTVINLMIEDIIREAAKEIIDSKEVRIQIGKETALLFKQWLNKQLSRKE